MPGIKDIPGDFVYRFRFAAIMTGATADDEFVAFIASSNLKITGAKWVPDAAVTHSASNYTTVGVRNRKADASGAALPATRSYAATDSVAFVAEAMTLSGTAADLLVASGDVITVQRVHTAAGVLVPAGVVEISAQYR